MICRLTLILLSAFSVADSSRILFIPAHSVVSHTKSMYQAGEVLKRAGHDVTVLQLLDHASRGTVNKAGIDDRIISTVDHNSTYHLVQSLPWQNHRAWMFYFGWKFTTSVCLNILSHESTRKALFAVYNETWDAIMVNDLFALCGLLGITDQLFPKGTVIVDFSTTYLSLPSVEPRGTVTPISLGVMMKESTYDYKRFFHRLSSAFFNFQFSAITDLLGYMVPYWGRHLGLGRLTLKVLGEKSAFAVTSVPSGFDFPQPRTLEMGEFDNTCSTEAALSEPFASFIQHPGSKGTVLFAVGHFVDWDTAPAGVVDAFVEAFARLQEYRIVWQFAAKSTSPKNLSSNVLIRSWIPQSAILNHPKTKAFISHMGYKSMREAICSRVPVVALPMFSDQFRNTAAAQRRGFAVFLDKTKLTTDSIYQSIKRVLEDRRYSDAVGRLQDQMNDRILNATALFTFQLEYSIRRSDPRLSRKYIRNNWDNMPILTRWWQAELMLPFAVIFVLFYKIIL